jgi:hypothetical protein
VNLRFSTDKISIQFLEVRTRGVLEGKTRVVFNEIEQRQLSIDPELAKILGFSQSVFRVGTHTSDKKQSYDAYNKLSKDRFFNFKLFTWVESSINIAEPTEFSMDALLVFMSVAFVSNNLKVSFELDDKILSVNIYDTFLRFQLPKNISLFVGLSESLF